MMIRIASLAKTLAAALALMLTTLVLANGIMSTSSDSSAADGLHTSRIRGPDALALTKDGLWLFVANERSGTISVVDTKAQRVTAELSAGSSAVDLAFTPDQKRLLVADRSGNQLLVFPRAGGQLGLPTRLKLPESPITIQVTPDGSRASVASLWAHRLTIVALAGNLTCEREVVLPFAPRCQLVLDDQKALVAAAFGGDLAVVDLSSGVVESVRAIPSHNIRSLTRSADRKCVWFTEQMLNTQGHTQLDDIRWGNLITNNLRALRIDSLLNAKADILAGSDLIHLGELDHGTGDPSCVVNCGTLLAVGLAGVGEVAIGPASGEKWVYGAAGRRPVAMVASPDQKRLFVADAGTDAVRIVDVNNPGVAAQVSLGNRPQPTAAERGEDLFYDARLSHQGWLSCHSCHTDGHTSGKLADTFSDGTFGTPKRVLSLLGVSETGPWAWNGSMKTLEQQVEKSLTSTMQGHEISEQQVQDLTAYVKSLKPAPKLEWTTDKNGAARRGQEIFARNNCSRCHTPPAYTSAGSYDVGLHDEVGARSFNPPSLRGVSQGGPYFHDGRAKSLGEVFQKYRHQLKTTLTAQEVSELMAYLRTL
jgi:YVTN family beta-propeller protein